MLDLEGVSDPIHIISLGAGVQSSTMALMAAKGEITPMPVAAIFADTLAEPKSVYVWLDWLEKQLPFPVLRVTANGGTLEDECVRLRPKKSGVGFWTKCRIPAFIKNPDGSKGIQQRQCTHDYKIVPVVRETKRLMKERGALRAVEWVGISLDEALRMKEGREKRILRRFPLVEARISRHDCIRWMTANKFPKPPKSACVFCPFHDNREWRRLKVEEPEAFLRAVTFELSLQASQRRGSGQHGLPYLHASLKPLSEVDFSTEEERGQLNMFNNECEGMCGV